jgi:hypothetical protein
MHFPPEISASEYRNQVLEGLDSFLYISLKNDKTGKYEWRPISYR